jgi:N-acetylglucosamine-6-phosphate deacetylase
LAAALDFVEGVTVAGFHLEGPFLAIAGAGGRTISGDVGFLKELLSAADWRVKVMSVSPDCPNVISVIECLREHNIAAFLTHTQASVSQETTAAIAAGARHATHFYNVFPAPAERERGVRPVGAVEAILSDDRCTVDFICDGVHVDPMAIKLAIAAKGSSKVVAITDSNVGAGLEAGVYPTDWGYSVKVSSNDAARVNDADHPLCGALAGSALTMNRAISNLDRWLDLPPHEVWAMGTRNAADVIGKPLKGRLEVGADADLVLWRQMGGQLQAVRTWVNGKCVYSAESPQSSTSNRVAR